MSPATIQLAAHNDAIAERAVTLGGPGDRHRAAGREALLARAAPGSTRRATWSASSVGGPIDTYLAGVRESRLVVEQRGDTDTVDLLTGVVSDFE